MLTTRCPHALEAISQAVSSAQNSSNPSFADIKASIIPQFENTAKSCKSENGISCKDCDEKEPHLWACLSCNYIGCGRSQKGHAKAHFLSNPKHFLCVNPTSLLFWCYGCDQELELVPKLEIAELSLDQISLQDLLYGISDILNPAPSDLNGSESDDEIDDDDTKRHSKKHAQMKKYANGSEESDENEFNYDWSVYLSFLKSNEEWIREMQISTNSGTITKGLCGLKNVGNTCYMNAALQCLSNVSPLRQVFLGPSTMQISYSGSQVLEALASDYSQLVQSMWSGQYKSLAPAKVLYDIRYINPMFRGYSQHDSQEFLRCILDSLHDGLKRPNFAPHDKNDAKKKTQHSSSNQANNKNSKPIIRYESPISTLFQGNLLSTVVCGYCNQPSYTLDSFFDLSLSIPDSITQAKIDTRKKIIMEEKLKLNSSTANMMGPYGMKTNNEMNLIGNESSSSTSASKGWFGKLFSWFSFSSTTTLQNCLHGFCTPDELTGSDKYRCDHCKNTHDATKSFSIAKLPPVLCIHIKRFKYDFFGSKISDQVDFPLRDLDLSDFVTTPKSKPNNQSESPVSNDQDAAKRQTGRPKKSASKKSTKTNGDHPADSSKDNTTTSNPETDPANFETWPLPKYDLVGVICHSGSLSGGHYYAYCLNKISNEWYEFNDSQVDIVSEEVVLNSEAYVLFYEQQMSPSRLEEIEKYKSLISNYLKMKQNEEEQFINSEKLKSSSDSQRPKFNLPEDTQFISMTWLNKWMSVNKPGPVNAAGLLCQHGLPLPNISPGFVVPVSPSIASYFVKTYGGSTIKITTEPCSECEVIRKEKLKKEEEAKQALKAVRLRQEEEYAAVKKFEALRPQERDLGFYFIDERWIDHWVKFATKQRPDCPGPIDNNNVSKNTRPRSTNHSTWNYLYSIYGGGPIIRRPTAQLNARHRADEESAEDSSSSANSSSSEEQ